MRARNHSSIRNINLCCCWCLLLCFTSLTTSAQSFDEYKRQQQAKYNSFVQKKTEEFRAYRDRMNAEYADFMRRAWTREEAKAAEPLPTRPEPPKPEERDPLQIPRFDAIPFGDVIDAKLPDFKRAEPVIPIDELEQLVITAPEDRTEEVTPQEDVKPREDVKPIAKPLVTKPKGLTFKWCGLSWNVPLATQHIFQLRSTKEDDVADAWKMLSGTKYAGIVAACLKIRDAHQLPDWGYLHFLEAMANAFLPELPNEARLLEMFILVQSGYQVRIARANNQLFILIPSHGSIYEYSSLTIGCRKFFVADKKSPVTSYEVFEQDFPKEQPFIWQMKKTPLLFSENTTRELQALQHPEVKVTVNISKELISFLNEYPRCNDWDSYARASLSEQAKDGLYPTLQQHIGGKSEAEAVETLLDFVQTAFTYQTDDRQFGEERSLFGDETLFYPYCDCEDRSILFSILVHELVGLDVILLNYPEHLATAVRFNGKVEGDYVTLDGHRYVVCDPTYIGGHVGEAMPRYKQTKATIIKL